MLNLPVKKMHDVNGEPASAEEVLVAMKTRALNLRGDQSLKIPTDTEE
jgi:hypothetical protein